MSRLRRRLLSLALVCGCVIAFLLSPLFPFVRSLAVMRVYSGMHQRQSLLAEEGIRLHIPGGLATPEADWYPFVMTFTADAAYAAYTGQPDARLTILYNFPAFDLTRGCSRLYDPNSPYYNGFYGAYLVRDGSNAALAGGDPHEDAAAQIAAFDFFTLVLGDFGLTPEERVFDFTVTERASGVTYAGYEGWTKFQAEFTVNGSAHNAREGGVLSYLQYGAPGFGPVAEEFTPVEMHGIVCARYFPEWDAGVYFYVMGTSAELCRACDQEILSKSTLEAKP